MFVLIAVSFWGGSASLAKYLFTTRFDVVIISQMRVSLSFIVLAGFFLLKDRTIFIIAPKDIARLVSLGIIGVALTNFAYYFTVQESTVATAILIQYTAPMLVMVYAVAISKEEEFNLIKTIALILTVAGCFLAVTEASVSAISLKGWALVTGPAAALCYAYMLVAGKRVLRSYRVWTMLVYTFGVASLFWLLVNPPWVVLSKGYTTEDWLTLWMFAVVSILIPHAAFSVGLKLLDASSVGITSTLEPMVAIGIAYCTLGEVLTVNQILGALAVVAGVGVLQLASKHKRITVHGGRVSGVSQR
jgi:DME family drug/metabolite transporter